MVITCPTRFEVNPGGRTGENYALLVNVPLNVVGNRVVLMYPEASVCGCRVIGRPAVRY